MMRGFVQGADRQQTTLLPECLDDWVDESNSIRAVDVFVDALELRDLGFDGVDPAATGRPVAAGSTPSNPRSRSSNASTNTSTARIELLSSTQSSRHSGNSVVCWRSAP